MAAAKVFVYLLMLSGVASFCIREQKEVSCYNEISVYDYYVDVKSLFLLDSYISSEIFKDKFPSVETVYVTGMYTTETCEELERIVTIYGCGGE